MSRYYKLENKIAVPCSMEEWAYNPVLGNDSGRVAKDKIKSIVISTVFLGINYNWGDGKPMIFETMVFGGKLDEKTYRYSTWEEAEIGHKKMIEKVKESEKC